MVAAAEVHPLEALQIPPELHLKRLERPIQRVRALFAQGMEMQPRKPLEAGRRRLGGAAPGGRKTLELPQPHAEPGARSTGVVHGYSALGMLGVHPDAAFDGRRASGILGFDHALEAFPLREGIEQHMIDRFEQFHHVSFRVARRERMDLAPEAFTGKPGFVGRTGATAV